MWNRFILPVIASLVVAPGAAMAQQALPIDGRESGRVSVNSEVEYQFDAPSVGVLLVAVHSDGDVAVEVLDSDGQQLPNGYSDRDLNGSVGAEQLSVILNEPGRHRVSVESLGRSQDFEIGASWLSFPAFERPLDPDRRPSRGLAVAVGQDHVDELDGESGDHWDWFVMTPAESGILTVVLRPFAGDPDLVLELYAEDTFSESTVRSDQDLQDTRGNDIGIGPGRRRTACVYQGPWVWGQHERRVPPLIEPDSLNARCPAKETSVSSRGSPVAPGSDAPETACLAGTWKSASLPWLRPGSSSPPRPSVRRAPDS